MKIQRKFYQYQGTKQSYLECGSPDSPPLLLTHATGFAAGCYNYHCEKLGQDYRVIAPDFFGHGESENYDFKNWFDLAGQLEYLLHELSLTSISGIGHSIGAAAQILLMSKRPSLYNRLVCFDPPIVSFPTFLILKIIGNPKARTARKRRDQFKNHNFVSKAFKRIPLFAEFHPNVYNDFLESCFAPGNGGKAILACDKENEAKTFESNTWQVPFLASRAGGEVHLFLPRRERVCSRGVARRVAKNNKRSTLTYVDGGHLFPFEKPNEFLKLVSGKL